MGAKKFYSILCGYRRNRNHQKLVTALSNLNDGALLVPGRLNIARGLLDCKTWLFRFLITMLIKQRSDSPHSDIISKRDFTALQWKQKKMRKENAIVDRFVSIFFFSPSRSLTGDYI